MDIKNLNPQSVIPLYKQIVYIISDKIKSGAWKPGDRIPSETELMQEFNVSRITIRSATNELVENGMIIRGRGKGSFVAPENRTSALAKDDGGLTAACIATGKTLETKVLFLDYVFPSIRDSEFLHISPETQILESRRLRIIDGKKAILETNHYAPSLSFLKDEDMTKSLFSILAKHGIHTAKVPRQLEICYSTEEESGLLDTKPNTPMILFRDQNMTLDKIPLFTSKQLYNTDTMIIYI